MIIVFLDLFLFSFHDMIEDQSLCHDMDVFVLLKRKMKVIFVHLSSVSYEVVENDSAVLQHLYVL